MITFDNVTKRYPDGTVAVNALDLEVPAGKTVVLVGPSGCGKTTTLRMVNRLVEPTEGRVLLDGTDVRRQNPARLRRGIGDVIQHTGLFPHRPVEATSARAGVRRGGGRGGPGRGPGGCCPLAGLPPGGGARSRSRWPGGQQRGVGVARARGAAPPVLLMDEPFSAVDPVVRAAL